METAVTWSCLGRVWWLMFWRTTVMFVVVSAAGGVLTGIAQEYLGFGYETARIVYTALALPAFGVAAFAAIWMGLRKRFRGFRLAIVPTSSMTNIIDDAYPLGSDDREKGRG